MAQLFRSIGAAIVRFFFPPKCVLCDRIMEEAGRDICTTCYTAASVFMHYPWKIPHVHKWIALWSYSMDVRWSILRYKFWHRRSYATTFARELAKKIADSKLEYDMITWVPISFWRRKSRGYDQTQLVACAVGDLLKQPAVKLLHKKRHNRKQSSIKGKKARQNNVRGVYRAVNAELLQGKRVLLIDDIVTTGATVSEAANTLRQAGAKQVVVACLAAAPGNQFRPQ